MESQHCLWERLLAGSVGFEIQVSPATEQSELPHLATESGNKTQERETLCSAHLATSPHAPRDADHGYGYTGTWLVSQECSSINKDKAE